jgi:SAM-dependent methyltransferase
MVEPRMSDRATDPFADLKARQALTWGAAPFERITETFADIHDRLIACLEPRPGERWLDLATGTGPLALRAARAGAAVTGVDLAPALIATARRLAAAAGLRIAFEVGDCERLTHPAAGFDVVVSSFGTIFAPDHGGVVGELARVCRPGGRLGLAAWQPGGGAARMAEVVMAFQPGPPPHGAGNPFDWGREEYVRSRLHDAFELEFLTGESPQIAPSAEAVWDLYVTSAGPVKTLAGTLPSDRREALHRAFVSLVDAHHDRGGIRFPREYLLVLGRRR